MGRISTSPLHLGGPQTRGQSERCPTNGQNCYITLAFLGVPKQVDKVKGPPQMCRIATSPVRSWGSPNKGTKSKVPHKWLELLHHPCVLRGPQTRPQSQRWPPSGQNCYITPAFLGPPNKGTKSKVPHKWAELLYHPCVLGGPQTRGQSQRWPANGQNCYITPASRGFPNKETKSKVAHKWAELLHHPYVLVGLITPASRGSPNKGTKSKVAHKWAELLHHPCVLGGPQTREQSQRWPTSGQNSYITLAFLGVPKQGDKVKGAPQVGTIAISPLRSRGSPNKGTKSKVPHKWAELLYHPCVLGGPQTRGQSQRSPTSGQNCYITLAFSGVPKQGDKVKGAPKVGRIATSPLRSWGSPNKGTKSKVAHKWAEFLHHPFVLGGPQTRGQNQRCPTSGQNCYITPAFCGVPKQGDKVKGGPQVGRIATSPLRSWGPQTRRQSRRCSKSGQNCYITPAFSGVPKQGDKIKGAPQVGRIATSPLRSRGSPNKGTKSKVPHKWAELLHHPCVLRGPQTRGQSQRCPTSGQNCYITPAFSGVPTQGDKIKGAPQVAHKWQNCYITPAFCGVPKQGDKVKGGPQVGRIATSPLRSWGPQTRRQSRRCPKTGQNCYITPAFSGVPKQGDKIKGAPQVGRIATSPLRSAGSPNKGTKSKVAHKWAELLHHPCVLGGPQTRGQNQRCPTSGQNCYITPAFSGVPKQGDKIKGAPQVGRIATSPLRSAGSPNKGTKSKVPPKWAELLHHPCVLRGPQTRGQNQRCPTSGQNCYITPAFCGVPKQGDKVKGGRQVGRIATSPLRSWGPQTRRQSRRCPKSGQNCYITPAFSGVPKQGDKIKGAPQVGRIATSPLRSAGSPNKGTKSKVAPKWAELLHHPCVLGVPKQGDKVKGAPQVGRIATSPLRSAGSPNKGTKSKVPHKWAELLHHPCVLRGPQTRGQSQRWPPSGQNCYITHAFSGVPKQGDKVNGAPQVGRIATSPLRSRGSPNKGTKSKVAHKWEELLHHPCVLGGPQTRGQNQRCPTSGQNCYITPAFSGVPKQGDKIKGAPQVGRIATSPLRSAGSPNKGTKSKVPHKWAELLHHPCVLGGPHTRGQNQRCPTSGQNCYITPAFCGVPKQGDKVKGGPQVGRIATSPLRSWGPQTRRQSRRCPKTGQNCYITPAFSGVPKQGDKIKGAPQVGRIATSPLRSAGSPNKGTKSKVAHKWAELLHHPCVLGGPQTRGQNQRCPTSGQNCYITPAFSGVPKQGDKIKGAPQVGRIATSPLRSAGSPNKGTKSKVPPKWAELLHHPCVLRGPQTRGQNQRCPTSGQNCYITPAFCGVPKQGDKVKGGRQVGRIATSPLRSWGPQTRRQSRRCPKSGQNCYITPAFSGVPKQGDKIKGAPQVGRIATSPLRSAGSPNKGTKSKVAPKWAELLHHPCVLGVPKQGDKVKGAPQVGRIATSPLRSAGSPNKGTKSKVAHKWAELLHHPCVLGVPKQGDKVKGAPQVGRIATSPLRSAGSPNKGTKSKVPHKWAELLHHPCVLRGPQTRGQSQRWPPSGQNCYITHAFSGVPKQGDKVNGAPQVGRIATSPLRSRGSPNKGTKSKVAHKWEELLHHPCVLGGPQTRGQNQRCPTSGQNCYITPAFSGVPKQGDKIKGAPQVGRIATSPLRSGQNCYITPAFCGGPQTRGQNRGNCGVPKQGDKVKGAPQVGRIATSPLRSRGSPKKGTKSKVPHKWAELLHHPCVLRGSQPRGQSQRWPPSGQNCYITLAFLGSPNKETKSKVPQKWAELLHPPCVLGGPQTRGQSQRWPANGQNCYITPASRGSPNKETKSKVAHKWAELLHHPYVLVGLITRASRGSPNKGTKSKVAGKWAELLYHPCVSGVPKQGDKVKGCPQVGRIATSPLRSWGSPNKGAKSKVPHKWAELLHHPCILGGPQTRGQSQRCPTSGRNCYITPAFSGVPKQGHKVKGAPQMGRIATSLLRSWGSPNK